MRLHIIRIGSHGALKGRLRLGPMRGMHIGHGDRHVRLGERAVARERGVRGGEQFRSDGIHRGRGEVRHKGERLAQARVRASKVGVAGNRFTEHVGRNEHLSASEEEFATEIEVVGFSVARAADRTRRCDGGAGGEPGDKRRGHGARDVVLGAKDVLCGAIEILRPEFAARLRVAELCRNAELLADPPHGPLDDVLHLQRFAELAHVEITSPAKSVRGAARGEMEARHAADLGRQFIGDAVGEVILRRVATDIDEGNHGEHRLDGRYRRRRPPGEDEGNGDDDEPDDDARGERASRPRAGCRAGAARRCDGGVERVEQFARALRSPVG